MNITAIKKYDLVIKGLEHNDSVSNDYAGEAYHSKALACIGLRQTRKAMNMFNEALKLDKDSILYLCNRGKLLGDEGRQQEALNDFKKAYELCLQGKFGSNIVASNKEYIKSTLATIVELEEKVVQIKEKIQLLDQKHLEAIELKKQFKILERTEIKIINEKIDSLEESEYFQLTHDSNNTDKLLDVIAELEEKIDQLGKENSKSEERIDNLEDIITKIHEELASKFEDFGKELNDELLQSKILPDDIIKITEYYKAFIGTFSSVYITSQMINNGQILGADNLNITTLSTLASFAPFIDDKSSETLTSINDFLQNKEIIINAGIIKKITPNVIAVGKLLGNTALKIVINKDKQKQITSITDKELEAVTNSTSEKILKFYQNIGEQLNESHYSQIHDSPAAKLGNKDANYFIEQLLNQEIIVKYHYTEQFVETMTKDPEMLDYVKNIYMQEQDMLKLSTLKAEHDQKISLLKTEHDQKVNFLEMELNQKISTLEAEHDQKVSLLETERNQIMIEPINNLDIENFKNDQPNSNEQEINQDKGWLAYIKKHCVIYTISQIKYDNPYLNQPELLKKLALVFGSYAKAIDYVDHLYNDEIDLCGANIPDATI